MLVYWSGVTLLALSFGFFVGGIARYVFCQPKYILLGGSPNTPLDEDEEEEAEDAEDADDLLFFGLIIWSDL